MTLVLTTHLPMQETQETRRVFYSWIMRIPWRRAWQPTQYYCLKNPMDRVAWQATVYRGAKSWTQLKWCTLPRHSVQFNCSVKIVLKIKLQLSDFASGAVFKTLDLHCRRCSFNPCLGINLHAMQNGQKKKLQLNYEMKFIFCQRMTIMV